MSREVLAPPLLRIGANRCYRVNLVHEDFNSQQAAAIRAQQHGQTTSSTVYAEEGKYIQVHIIIKREFPQLETK